MNELQITEIELFPVKPKDPKLVAFCSISLGGLIKLNSIKIVRGKNGLFVSWPGKYLKEKEKTFLNFEILNKKFKKEIETQIHTELILKNLE